MILQRPVIDSNAMIDFYAGSNKEFGVLKSLYESLPENRRGTFYTSPPVSLNGIPTQDINRLDGFNPLVIASYKDLHDTFYLGEERPFIIYEIENNRDTKGLLNTVSLFLCRDETTAKFRMTYSDVFHVKDDLEASKYLLDYIKGKEVKLIEKVNGHSIGMIYMCFGNKAGDYILKSIATLKRLGFIYPVLVVGDTPVKGFDFIKWEGQSPFDTTKRTNFKFRAGRIKPYIYDISPFDYTLYIDADTQFIQDPIQGFELLKDHDLCLTEETLSLKDLYNKKLAGWEINILERDTTVIELGGNDLQKFINSGVVFFRKSKEAKQVFENWAKEWVRFQEWDEQLSLMRSINSVNDVKVKRLGVEWNDPFPHDSTVIFHNYGRGNVRINPK